MKKLNVKLLSLLLLLIASFSGRSQTLLQKVSETNNGPADTLGAFPILKNSDSTIVFAGNERINAQQCNFKTFCHDTSGVQTWSQTFNANIQKAYTTASIHDAFGNIFVVGCTYIDSVNKQDLTVIKYDADGNFIWDYYYNGPSSMDDIATDIALDNAGNIYVTGAVSGMLSNLADYVTIKLNNSGAHVWTSIYDYANLVDIPMGVRFLPGSNRIVVSGTSGSSFNNYDFATVQYNGATGNQITVNRQSSPTAGLNKGVSMAVDASENIYFTGTVWNGSDYDLQVTKFNSSLVLQWSYTYDGYGFDDAGYSVVIDNSSDVVVTGFLQKNIANTSRELILLKLSPAGVLQWNFKNQPVANNSLAEGIKVKVDGANNIYLGGNQIVSGNQDAFVMKFSEFGKPIFAKSWNSSNNDKDIFYDLMIDGSDIYISALSKTGSGVYDAMVIKYQERNVKPVFTNPSTTPHASNHIIIKFDPAIVKTAAINNREFLFGDLRDFVPDSTVTKINAKLSSERYTCNSAFFKTSKIFKEMTTGDSLSITRLGDTIKIPKFYSALLVEIPADPMSYGLVQSSQKLNEVKPDIYYSELNYSAKLAGTPNDNLYNMQAHLHPTPLYPDAHINADSAWSLANGQPHVKVGIFDSGILSQHVDLTDFNGNPNVLGYNFADHNPYIGADTYIDGHGTQVTGIIAAARNNNIGVTGIAGRNDSLNTQGVTLYDCKILTMEVNPPNYDSLASAQTIAEAMMHSSRGDSTGFGIHVMNHSWVFNLLYQPTDTAFKNKTLQDQIVFASRNGVAIAGSKGWLGTFAPLPGFPADWNPEIVSSVGGSGTDGHGCQFSNNNCYLATNTLSGLNTNWGVNIDFVAPAALPSISTTGIINFATWTPFGGTSASAAHVSGAYALMMSYFNHNVPHWDNLLHEDCENILKRTCTDLTSTIVALGETPGYDKRTGYGKINVNAAIKAINNQHYRFRHLAKNHGAAISTAPVLVHSSVSLKWPAYNNLPAGIYNTNVYKVTTTLTYTLNSTETIIDSWPMYKECYGWAPDTASNLISIDKPYYSKVVSANNTTAVLETYIFQNLSNNMYYPNSLSDARSAITLYTYDSTPTLVGINKNNQEANRNFMLRPNPNNGNFYIFFGSEISTNLYYSVYDMLGKEISRGTYLSHYGENNIPVNLYDCSNGIYVVNVSDDNKIVYRQKVIKH